MSDINTDEQSILSAIWILSCTDKIPQMTFRGIKERLTIPSEINIEKLIKKRIELFRLGIPTAQLNEWKKNMSISSIRPTWVAKAKDSETEISKINKDNVFRNRFRNSLDAKAVPVEIIQWGLTHIDQMYSLEDKKKEKRNKWVSMIFIPIFSLVFALASIFISYLNTSNQQDLKKYELSLTHKHEGYTSFMVALDRAYMTSVQQNSNGGELLNILDKMVAAYYNVQPFIAENKALTIWEEYLKFSNFCLGNLNSPNHNSSSSSQTYIKFRDYFRDELSAELIYNE